MKVIDISHAIDPVQQPFLAGSLDFVQQQIVENVSALVKSMVGTYTTNDVAIVNGCVITGTPGPGLITMTAGAIYYNGNIYLVPSASFTTTGAQIPVWTIVQSQAAIDPVLFVNGGLFSVHNIFQFVLVAGPVGGSGVAGYVCDYNSSNFYPINDYGNGTPSPTATFDIALVTNNCTGTITSSSYIFEKTSTLINLYVLISYNISAVGTGNKWYNFEIIPIVRYKSKKSRSLISSVKTLSGSYDSNNVGGLGSDSSGNLITGYDNTFTATVGSGSIALKITYSI